MTTAFRRVTRAKGPSEGQWRELAALEEERDFLLGSLRDLDRERDAGDLDDADYRSLHDDYTARAAAVLRALDAARRLVSDPFAHQPPRTPSSANVEARHPGASQRGMVITVAVLLIVAVGAGIAVATLSGERVGGMNMSGTTTSATARHTAKAQQLEGQGRAADALKEYDAAISADPSNVVALTYRGWLLARAGLTDRAMTSLDKAIATNPAYPDAHFFRGMVLYEAKNDPAGAVTELEAYLASRPPASAAAAVQSVLDKARQAAAKPPG
ncbi:MAG: tetratricopeptide repeat protein [Acidimicrobiales bacterium]